MVMSTHPRSHTWSSCICKAAGQVGRQPSNPSIPLSLNRHSSHPGPLENSRSCILIVADASLLFKWSQKPRVYIYIYIIYIYITYSPRPFQVRRWHLATSLPSTNVSRDGSSVSAKGLWLIAAVALEPRAALVLFQLVAQGTSVAKDFSRCVIASPDKE